ncbi:fibrinogen-like protein 1 isoform 2-T2 [Clarias gariepinus]|nr:fibrinogen-like protein 1 isoform X2 [Clarias gariepinus]
MIGSVRMKMIGCAGLLLITFSMVTSTIVKEVSGVAQGTDCTQIKTTFPHAKSGIYTIHPSGLKNPIKVYCEMRQDGGWTVIQRRSGEKVSFNQNWKKYKWGFGNIQKDHWLGLNKIWALTKSKDHRSTLRVDLWDFEGGSAYANYEDFWIGGEKTAYKLHVGKYSGTAGDAIRGSYAGIDQNGYGFSTHDHDNDGCSPCIFGDIAVNECTRENIGGWWFSSCGSAELNGKWHSGEDNRGWASGLHWLTWRGPGPYSAKATRMMVKTIKQS